jgi:hypothetical protein
MIIVANKWNLVLIKWLCLLEILILIIINNNNRLTFKLLNLLMISFILLNEKIFQKQFKG